MNIMDKTPTPPIAAIPPSLSGSTPRNHTAARLTPSLSSGILIPTAISSPALVPASAPAPTPAPTRSAPTEGEAESQVISQTSNPNISLDDPASRETLPRAPVVSSTTLASESSTGPLVSGPSLTTTPDDTNSQLTTSTASTSKTAKGSRKSTTKKTTKTKKMSASK